MRSFIKKKITGVFLIVFLAGVSLSAENLLQKKENFQTFINSIESQKNKKIKNEAAGTRLVGLLDSIVEGLQKGKDSLIKVGVAFNDVCDIIGDVNTPKLHHIRELESKIKVLVELLDGDDEFDEEDAELVQNIRVFIEGFEIFLGELDLGGLGGKIIDVFYHKPLKWLGQYKYGKEIATGVTLTTITAVACLITWWKLSKKESGESKGTNPILSDLLDALDDDSSDEEEGAPEDPGADTPDEGVLAGDDDDSGEAPEDDTDVQGDTLENEEPPADLNEDTSDSPADQDVVIEPESDSEETVEEVALEKDGVLDEIELHVGEGDNTVDLDAGFRGSYIGGDSETVGVPIAELNLPNRIVKCLEKAGIQNRNDLAVVSDEDLLSIKGFGKKSLEKVKDALAANQ